MSELTNVVLRTERIGQLTGTKDDKPWPLPLDPEGWPLLNDTGKWGALGMDLGANTVHSDGRLYFFSGDVATNQRPVDPPLNSDLVAWTDDPKVLRFGGHLAMGLNFRLPAAELGGGNGQPGWRFCGNCGGLFWDGDPNFKGVCVNGRGQPDWRYCGKCGGLFWDGDPNFKGLCPRGQTHSAIGLNFVLPSNMTGGGIGQAEWRFCGNCGVLFWNHDASQTRCPSGEHHSAIGWEFILPAIETGGGRGQSEWHFCRKCCGLFWNMDPWLSACPAGDQHEAAGWNFVLPSVETGGGAHSPIGLQFILPAKETGAGDGQPDWRYCGKCGGLFWWGNSQPGTCPRGGGHAPTGWNFVLPLSEAGGAGQSDWYFCIRCGGLYWDGDSNKGVCPGAPGGGLRLHAVMSANDPSHFDVITATPPVEQTLSLETPGGAFSFNGRVYLFVNISEAHYSGHARSGNPAYGTYLINKAAPDRPGSFQTNFLVSPRMGWCPVDDQRQVFESHSVLGFNFALPLPLPNVDAPNASNWRRCAKCAELFWNGNASKGQCFRGGEHAEEPGGNGYVLPQGIAEDSLNQSNWRLCARCFSLFWNGDPQNTGLCPAGGRHEGGDNVYVLPHDPPEDDQNQGNWRFCGKCNGLFFDGYSNKGACPKGGGHDAQGFYFVLPHNPVAGPQEQNGWSFCHKCAGIYFGRDDGVCPGDHGKHEAAGFDFTLPHDTAEDLWHQGAWRFCGKCAGMFFDGYPDKGVCPADGAGHSAPDGSFQFVLPHSIPEQWGPQWGPALHERNWRFCTRCFSLTWTGQPDVYSGIAPWVVQNGEHPGVFPQDTGTGLVMFGFGYVNYQYKPGFRLAWMPLNEGGPRLQDIRYYTGSGNREDRWSDDDRRAADIFARLDQYAKFYTSISAAWLAGPKRWIVLYSNANDQGSFGGHAIARIGATPWSFSEEIPIFDPQREQGYTRYMHQPGIDRIHPDIPPMQAAGANNPGIPGWAYGAYLVNRFTEWNAETKELGLYYVLSFGSPYQIQLMYTRLDLTSL